MLSAMASDFMEIVIIISTYLCGLVLHVPVHVYSVNLDYQ